MSKFKFGDKVVYKGELLVAWRSTENKTACLTRSGILEAFDNNKLKAVSDWIPCSERMPEPCVTVIATDGDCVCENYLMPVYNEDGDDSFEWRDFSMGQDVTHWMPLPTPPTE